MSLYVISNKNLPARLPLHTTILAYLLLDKFNASDVVWGVVGCFLAILWIVSIVVFVTETNVDIGDLLRKI